MRLAPLSLVAALSCLGITLLAQAPGAPPIEIAVAAARPGAAIAPTMYGIFFEDINFGADGGLYAEKVKNRSFEFADPLMGWKRAWTPDAAGTFEVRTDTPPSAENPHYLRVTAQRGRFGVANDGFRGVGIRKGERYTVSMLARQQGAGPGAIVVGFENNRNQPEGQATLTGVTGTWTRHRVTLTATSTNPRARVHVLLDGAGSVDLDMISVFPEDTWAGRENGLRRDLVELLRDMKPGFLRFPGGCIVEGRLLDGRYQWKTTIGDPSKRRLIVNRWNDEFPNRATPDYFQSFGLGFFEYFQLSEDLGAEPLPILNCGMACQFNSGELAPLEAIDGYIQDALDLIEFANGPVTSTWGARRAELGHPAPFHLTLLGVGNEQWGPQYVERYALFEKVLSSKHPEITLVASADPNVRSENFRWQWDRLRELGADLVDEHFYQPPAWFLENVGRYDAYPRTGPKLFVGEYAAHEPMSGATPMRPSTLRAAIAEAAFMTGMERNADLVRLSAYAPLLAHVDAWQWTPNLIWFDNLRAFGTPSYHVQQLFGANRGAHVLPVTIDGAAANGTRGVFSSASLADDGRGVIVKLVNAGAAPVSVAVRLDGRNGRDAAEAVVLTGAPDAENSFAQPDRVSPVRETAGFEAGRHARTLPAHSLTVLRVSPER